jgi:PKD repeat protein
MFRFRMKEGKMPRPRCCGLNGIFLVSLFLMGLLFSSSSLLSQGSISFTPSSPNVEEPVMFTLTPPGRISGTVQWDFGDKSTASGGTTISHKYLSTGSFVVKATVTVGGRPNTAQIKVGVTEKRRVSFMPPAPKTGDPVAFQAKDFLTSSIKWDFGDRTTKTSGPNETHAYTRPGTFTVTATDLRGTSCCPVKILVTVAAASLPSITFSPSSPQAGGEITFTASNFKPRTSIKWDFGDGTILPGGASVAKHTYKMEGRYTVSASDSGGQATVPLTIASQALPQRGQTAVPFSISSIQLRFEDGKAYTQVPWNFTPLISYADIKYEGSGNFEAQWLLDGKPFKAVSQSFPSGKLLTFDSGGALPTQISGVHEITLNISKPLLPLTPPTIRYLVLSEGAQELVSLDMIEAKDKETGGLIVIDENRLTLSPGRDYLFKGTIKNVSGKAIPNAIVFITLAGRGVVQKRFSNLQPGVTKTFETSLLNEAGEQRFLRFEAFETAAKEKLLAQREFIILSSSFQITRLPDSPPLPAPTPPSNPVIVSLDPSSFQAGGGAIDPLTIVGSSFVEGAMARVRIAGETGTGVNYPTVFLDETTVEVTIPETWTSGVESLEFRVQNPDGSGSWVVSDWFPFQVTIGKIKAKVPPKVPAIKVTGMAITKLTPDGYVDGGGDIDPFIIEGKNFLVTDPAAILSVNIYFPDGNVYQALSVSASTGTSTLSSQRIQSSLPSDILHSTQDLEVGITVASAGGPSESERMPFPCLGEYPKVAMLSPNAISQHAQNEEIRIIAPQNETWRNHLSGHDFDHPDNAVVKIQPVTTLAASDGRPKGAILKDARCYECGASTMTDFLLAILPPEWTADVGDLAVTVGNPKKGGGYIWGNSLVLSIVPPGYSGRPGSYPETEITQVSSRDFPCPPRSVTWRGTSNSSLQEQGADIMGFEYAVVEEGQMPPSPVSWEVLGGEPPSADKWHWADSQTTSLDFIAFENEFPIPDGKKIFLVRAVDANGWRDQSPAKTPVFIVDRELTLEFRFTKLRVDDDADPPGNQGEVFFRLTACKEESHSASSRDLGQPPGAGDDLIGNFYFPTNMPCGYCYHIVSTSAAPIDIYVCAWHMGTGEYADIDVPWMKTSPPSYTLNYKTPWNSNVYVGIRGWELDEELLRLQDMGYGTIHFDFSPDEDSYLLNIGGDSYYFGKKAIISREASFQGADGAFTMWYTIKRIE